MRRAARAVERTGQKEPENRHRAEDQHKVDDRYRRQSRPETLEEATEATEAAPGRFGTHHRCSSRQTLEQPPASAPPGSIAREPEPLHRFAGYVAIPGVGCALSRRSGRGCAFS